MYCIFGHGKINAWFPRRARARDFVNFRKKNSCIARTRCARAGLTVYPILGYHFGQLATSFDFKWPLKEVGQTTRLPFFQKFRYE
jgi:hypothetical protein